MITQNLHNGEELKVETVEFLPDALCKGFWTLRLKTKERLELSIFFKSKEDVARFANKILDQLEKHEKEKANAAD